MTIQIKGDNGQSFTLREAVELIENVYGVDRAPSVATIRARLSRGQNWFAPAGKPRGKRVRRSDSGLA